MTDDKADASLDREVLDVYVSREGGWWNPDHGDVEIPDGWVLLPAGDAYLTRTVTSAGEHWVAWQPGDRRRGRRRRRLGVWAPEQHVEDAQRQADTTAPERSRRRERAAEQREVDEQKYRDELAVAIVSWLNFKPEHASLADQIARSAAERAAAVGSGRVGRTSTLSLREKAALAARAHIRHHHTDYEHQLLELEEELDFNVLDPEVYQAVRRDTHLTVDRFLDTHRAPADEP